MLRKFPSILDRVRWLAAIGQATRSRFSSPQGEELWTNHETAGKSFANGWRFRKTKRQTAEQAVALAKSVAEQNELQRSRRDRMMGWLLPRVAGLDRRSVSTNSGLRRASRGGRKILSSHVGTARHF
jgi:hypothetical protein